MDYKCLSMTNKDQLKPRSHDRGVTEILCLIKNMRDFTQAANFTGSAGARDEEKVKADIACEQGSNGTASETAAGPQRIVNAVEPPITLDGPCVRH